MWKFSSRSVCSRRPQSRRRPLGLERLEDRLCLAAASIEGLAAQIETAHMVHLTGHVVDENPTAVVVSFDGVVTGSATADNDGYFELLGQASGLGTVTAVATDDESLASDPASVDVSVAAPAVSVSVATTGDGRYVTVSGSVQGLASAYASVGLSGIVAAALTADASGAFSATLEASSLGTVIASATDDWGQTGTATAELTVDAPTISLLSSAVGSDGNVQVSGDVAGSWNGQPTISFSGVASGQLSVSSGTSFSGTMSASGGGTLAASITDAWGRTASAEVNVDPYVEPTHNAPTVYVSAAANGNGCFVDISGYVLGDSPAWLTVWLGGVVSGSTTTDASGAFSATLEASALGAITASTTNNWGQSGSASTDLAVDAPTISLSSTAMASDGAIQASGEFAGSWNGQPTISFSGIASGQLSISSGNSYSATLSTSSGGTLTASMTDIWDRTVSATFNVDPYVEPIYGYWADTITMTTTDEATGYTSDNLVAVDDSDYFVFAGQTLNVAASGVLANDTASRSVQYHHYVTSSHHYVWTDGYVSGQQYTDPSSPPQDWSDTSDDYYYSQDEPLYVTAQLVTQATNGTVSLSADGSFTYTGIVGFVGIDSFTYYFYAAGYAVSNLATATIDNADAKLTNVIFKRAGEQNERKYEATSEVYADNGGLEDQNWVDLDQNGTDSPGDNCGPLVYKLGATIYAAPEFQVTMQGAAPDEIFVRGHAFALSRWDNDFMAEFSGKLKKQPGGGTNNTYTYSLMVGVDDLLDAKTALPNYADIFDDLTISWEISRDATNYSQSYNSVDQLYVARTNDPSDIKKVWHTAIEIGTEAAHGFGIGADDLTIADALMTEFSTREIYGYNSHQLLTYYGDPNCAVGNINGLLKTSDGHCTAWAQFFAVTLFYQHVRSVDIRAQPPDTHDPDVISTGLVVKNWDFDFLNPPSRPNDPAGYAYRFELQPGSVVTDPNPEFVMADGLGRQPGVEGQGHTPNPPSLFQEHYIVLVGSGTNARYYDPSYGESYDSFGAFEQHAIAGTYRLVNEQCQVLYMRPTESILVLREREMGEYTAGAYP